MVKPPGHEWVLQGPGRNELVASKEDWLAFAILRQLLPAVLLDSLFGRDVHGQPRLDPVLYGQQQHCLFSKMKSGQRQRLRITELPDEVGVRPLGQPQPPLDSLSLPVWVLGGRLRFRKGRWAYAPRQFSGAARWRAQRLFEKHVDAMEEEYAHTGVPADQETEDKKERLLRRLHYTKDPFVDVHKLLHQLKNHHPVQDKASTCHYGCLHATRPARCRCVHPGHLHWGSQADNAYHAGQHREELPAQPYRPDGWLPESSRPGYRLRLRLRKQAQAAAAP